MGFWDRFKKKEEPKVEQQKQPLTLQYSDGTVANVTFDGICDIEGKTVHAAHIEYIAQDGRFTSRRVLLEPITRTDENGNVLDATEEYYTQMAAMDGTQEARARYNAVKGFFKKQEITEEKMGSNYIGNIAIRQDGQYYRYFDPNFKASYIQTFMDEKNLKEQQAQAMHMKNLEDIQKQNEEIMTKGRRNQDIYSKLQSGIATPEETNEYYANVHHKYKDKAREDQIISE